MDDPALFHQYEQDYCNRSTEVSRKISALTGVSTGASSSRGRRMKGMQCRGCLLSRAQLSTLSPPLSPPPLRCAAN